MKDFNDWTFELREIEGVSSNSLFSWMPIFFYSKSETFITVIKC